MRRPNTLKQTQTPSDDWNSVDVQKIASGDQREISRLYNLTKPYFLKKIMNCELLFHDVLMRVIDKAKQYDEQRGKFSSFFITIAHRERARFYEDNPEPKRKKRIPTVELRTYDTNTEEEDFTTEPAASPEGWTVEELKEFEEIVAGLTQDEREFIESYQRESIELVQRRKKFARIKRKIVSMKDARD